MKKLSHVEVEALISLLEDLDDLDTREKAAYNKLQQIHDLQVRSKERKMKNENSHRRQSNHQRHSAM